MIAPRRTGLKPPAGCGPSPDVNRASTTPAYRRVARQPRRLRYRLEPASGRTCDTVERRRWLGLAPVLFGFAQAAGHGLLFPRLAKDRYSPGFLASLFLHVPTGIQYLRAFRDDAPIQRSDMARAGGYMIAFAVSSIAAPNVVLSDKNSPYRFTAKQLGRYT